MTALLQRVLVLQLEGGAEPAALIEVLQLMVEGDDGSSAGGGVLGGSALPLALTKHVIRG